MDHYQTNVEMRVKHYEAFQMSADSSNPRDIPLTEPFYYNIDQYLAKRKERLQKELRDSLTQTYNLQKALSRGDLAMLLGQNAGVSIPLPPNPVLNMFGKPELAINVNGQVNITVG